MPSIVWWRRQRRHSGTATTSMMATSALAAMRCDARCAVNGARSELADARRQIAGLCERMGLAAYGEPFTRAYVQNSPDETKRQLAAIVHVAGVIQGVVTHARVAAPGRDDSASATLASQALVLEDAANKAMHVCDRAICERAELAATKTERPVLNTGRHMNLHRTGDDR